MIHRVYRISMIQVYQKLSPISKISRSIGNFIRNVGIVAHIDAGKTTTSEQMLYACGTTKSVGRVDTGDTVMDFLPQERERGITISSAAITMKWKDYIINLIDTPGHVDFTIEVERSTRVLDGAVVILDAVSGVQAQTKTVWKQVNKQKIPAIAFINKMDRDGAEFYRSIESMKSKLGANPIAIQLPLGKEDTFQGVVDLITLEKIIWSIENIQVSSTRTPKPPQVTKLTKEDIIYKETIQARRQMLEKIAEYDDIFIEKFLELDMIDISPMDITQALRRICLKNIAIPTLCGASLRGKGVEPLLNALTTFLPSPYERPPQRAIHINSSNINNSNTSSNKIEKIIEIDPKSKDLCALAFKIINNRERGPLVFVRVYSGTLSTKQMIRNSTKGIRERAFQLLKVSADEMENIDEITVGNVGCIVGMKDTRTGDTLVSEKGLFHFYILEGLSIPPPVFSLSIQPEVSSQQKDFDETLRILSLEDPSLVVERNKESGQTLLKGIGELHLEIVCDKIRRDYNIEISTGASYVAFRETIQSTTDSGPITKSITYDKTIGMKRMFASVEFEISSSFYSHDPSYDISSIVKTNLTADEYTNLIDGFQNALIRGPLGYPIVGLNILVKSITKDQDTTPGAIRACVAMLLDHILRGEYRQVLEPIMSAEIDIPVQSVGDVLSDVSVKRRGLVIDVINHGVRSTVLAEVPLVTMLGYATYIRSLTHGEGNFSLEYLIHRPVDLSIVQGTR